MRKILCLAIGSILISACGGGGGGGRDNGGSGITPVNQDITKGGNCNTTDGNYQDSGYANGVKLKPGQMPSDISDSPITACSKGQFVFNGKCFDSLSFNDQSGLLSFNYNGVDNNILSPNQTVTPILREYCSNLSSFRNGCDLNVATGRLSLTLVWLSHYFSFTKRDSYSNFSLMDWTMKNSNSGFIIKDSATFKFRTSYGTCLNNNGNTFNVYDWYHNGSIKINNVNFNLPLSYNEFISVYSNAEKISCPEINTGFLTCYKINTSWGSEIFHFDDNNYLNILSVNYH